MVAVATSRALGTGVQVAVTSDAALDAADAVVRSWLDRIDLAASRFRDDSEITAVNSAAGRAVRVSPLLLRAVRTALDVAAITEGAVDPTVGGALIALGYDRDFDEVRTGATGRPPGPAPGWRCVSIDEAAATVRVPDGVWLDLGASAKALTADIAAEEAARRTGCGVLVSLGGDIATAGLTPDGGWRVHVTDDHAAGADSPGQTVALGSGALATSSCTVRAWITELGTAHHIVDPRTGEPAAVVWRTASVTARTCVEANALSTAAIVLGDAAPAFLLARRAPARLVAADGAAQHLNGWPEEGER